MRSSESGGVTRALLWGCVPLNHLRTNQSLSVGNVEAHAYLSVRMAGTYNLSRMRQCGMILVHYMTTIKVRDSIVKHSQRQRFDTTEVSKFCSHHLSNFLVRS